MGATIVCCAGLLGGCFAEPVQPLSGSGSSGSTTGEAEPQPWSSTGTTDAIEEQSGSTGGAPDSGTGLAETVGSASSSTGEPDEPGEPDEEEGSSTGTPELDCEGEPGGDAVLDACGICNGPGGPCWGCTVPSASNFDPLADVDDGTCTCQSAGGGVTDQSNLISDAGSGGQDQWQSFTTTIAGGLTRVDLGVGSPINGPSPGAIRIYEGEGLSGTELGSQEVTFDDVFNQVQEFSFDEPIPLNADAVYTLRFSVPEVTVGWVDVSGDVYAGGRASYGPDVDFVFRTVMAQCVPK